MGKLDLVKLTQSNLKLWHPFLVLLAFAPLLLVVTLDGQICLFGWQH